MAAFREANNFASEFALRTLLNCYQIYNCDKNVLTECEGQKLTDIYNKVAEKLQQNNYANLTSCFGTQLMNSLLGLLVFPQQQFWDEITKSKSENVWRRILPTLANYVFSDIQDVFYFNYFYRSKKDGTLIKEVPSIHNILRHMRNSVSHKRLSIYPQGISKTNEVEYIVFEDDNIIDDKTKSVFKLKINKNDLFPILLEISEYFTNIELYKEEIRELNRHR